MILIFQRRFPQFRDNDSAKFSDNSNTQRYLPASTVSLAVSWNMIDIGKVKRYQELNVKSQMAGNYGKLWAKKWVTSWWEY